ncbi:MAG: hypothetical protein H6632_02540 [Anaerolineales bacterium]|nr:hypothetical protein [Anaerolineales bacterium]
MIELYRPVHCRECADIEAALKEMVLAHRIIMVADGQQPDALPAATPLPAIKDEGQIFTGCTEIKAHLKELERIAFEWRKYQSDSCYTNEANDFCS